MSAFMNWNLIVRDEDEMARLGASIPDTQIEKSRRFMASNGMIVYAEWLRA
jgi:hypothetical protein